MSLTAIDSVSGAEAGVTRNGANSDIVVNRHFWSEGSGDRDDARVGIDGEQSARVIIQR